MGKRNAVTSTFASLGFFAIGVTLGAHRTRRRIHRSPSSCMTETETLCPPPTCQPAINSLPLDCPVCLTEFVLPRVAPCGHSLCTSCLASLFEHERRPACPVCRKKIKSALDHLPVNFALKSLVEGRVVARGDDAWDAYIKEENEVRQLIPHVLNDSNSQQTTNVVSSLRPAWNWFKWTVIIVTEFGAFLVSLKEVLESTPARNRRYQRIV